MSLHCNDCKYFFGQKIYSSQGTCVKRLKRIIQDDTANRCDDYADKEHGFLIENINEFILDTKRDYCNRFGKCDFCPFFRKHIDFNDCTFYFYLKALLEIKGVKEMDSNETETP